LSLYSGLADLYESEGLYKDHVARVTRHARVRSLYGVEDADSDADSDPNEAETADSPYPTTAPDEAKAERIEKIDEFVRNVDTRIIREAISRIDRHYVAAVDYRKVLAGTLRAMRVLVQSADLTETFEGLADQAGRAEFLAKLDAMIRETESRDLVSHGIVAQRLNMIHRINRNTVKIPDEVIDVEFADGMTEQLDTYTHMIWPSEVGDFNKRTMGSFFGVGIQIQMEHGLLKVISPLEDTPAFRAGIQAGDYIIKIDGKLAKNIDINDAVKLITGPRGTSVTLTIKRPGMGQFDRTIIRDEIHIQTVKGWKRVNGGEWDWMIDPANRIGYIRLTSFTADTAAKLAEALRQLSDADARGVILDLRHNPGGLLRTAVAVADEFLPAGKTIVSTRGRQQRESVGRATRAGSYPHGALVVLVDGYSASASEIVSGALKDHKRALIVGTRSFGKGVVQNLIQVGRNRGPDSYALLKVTTARYYLPGGRCLHRVEGAEQWGVEPDIKVPVTPRQWNKWYSRRMRAEVIRERTPGELDREMARQFDADTQLATALLACRLQALNDNPADHAVGPAAATATGR